MYFLNGIHIKARQISSWVLDVRGSEKPFRHSAGFLIVKIDGALYSFSAVGGERECSDVTMLLLFGPFNLCKPCATDICCI